MVEPYNRQEAGIALLYSQEQRSRERKRIEAIFTPCLPTLVCLYTYVY